MTYSQRVQVQVCRQCPVVFCLPSGSVRAGSHALYSYMLDSAYSLVNASLYTSYKLKLKVQLGAYLSLI